MHPFQDVAARYDVQVRLRPLPDGREEFGQLICLHGSHGYSSFTMREWAECLPGRFLMLGAHPRDFATRR
jgi:hypothetical protein